MVSIPAPSDNAPTATAPKKDKTKKTKAEFDEHCPIPMEQRVPQMNSDECTPDKPTDKADLCKPDPECIPDPCKAQKQKQKKAAQSCVQICAPVFQNACSDTPPLPITCFGYIMVVCFVPPATPNNDHCTPAPDPCAVPRVRRYSDDQLRLTVKYLINMSFENIAINDNADNEPDTVTSVETFEAHRLQYITDGDRYMMSTQSIRIQRLA